jgi:hypothetical protein
MASYTRPKLPEQAGKGSGIRRMDVGPIILFYLCLALVVGVISAAICGAIAPSRGHSVGTWAIIGFLAGASLGPIGLGIALVVLFAQPNRKRQMVYCPRCAQPLPYPVPACPRCGLSFVPPYPAYPPAPTDPLGPPAP